MRHKSIVENKRRYKSMKSKAKKAASKEVKEKSK